MRQTLTWTEDWVTGHGLHRLRSTVRYPKRRNHVPKITGKPYAGNGTYGLKGGRGTGAAHGHRPDYQ